MTELTNLTVAQIRDGHRAGDFSAVEVAEAFNANVAGAKALNAFIVETPELAVAAGHNRAAIADDEPPDEPPGASAALPPSLRFHGLMTLPK